MRALDSRRPARDPDRANEPVITDENKQCVVKISRAASITDEFADRIIRVKEIIELF
jgi:hypothetical protein